MANEAYIVKGTSLLFGTGGGADVAITAHGLANVAGRVSAQRDLGAAPRPGLFDWSCEVQFQATPTQGAALELYAAFAPDNDNTQIDGDIGLTDAALGDIDMRRNLMLIGVVTSENAAAAEICVASGQFENTKRYFSLVIYNNSGAAINATDVNFRFNLQSAAWQGQ